MIESCIKDVRAVFEDEAANSKRLFEAYIALIGEIETSSRRVLVDPNASTATLLEIKRLISASKRIMADLRQTYRTSPEIINQGLDIPDNGD